MWCPLSFAATGASSAFLLNAVQFFQVNAQRGKLFFKVEEFPAGVGWAVDVAPDDLTERTLGADLKGFQEVISLIIDNSQFSIYEQRFYIQS